MTLTRRSEPGRWRGATPSPRRAGEVFERAHALVAEAVEALASGPWRVAVYKAHQAIPTLRQLIHHLN
jgi:hypothetical protein